MSSLSTASAPERLTPDLASRFARIALGHVAREYPNKMDHVLDGAGDIRGPRDLHPIFFGSFDWHSCVHGYWLLASLLRLEPQIPEAGSIRALFEDAFTVQKVEGEVAYLRRPSARGFERPYGWGWLLKLQAELMAHDDHRWAAALRPLAEAFADRLLELFQAKARSWFIEDQDAPAWEPSGDDFLSPTLVEVECLRRLLPADDFRAWLADFLPDAAHGRPDALFTPATVTDRTDGKIVHLDGLNLSRAWCWREIAAALPPGDPVAAAARDAATLHLTVSLPHVAGDYMGEHWLASFALLALTAGEG
jgi:hypothetical protein